MIPREAKRGSSFKGAGMYYLHDKNALTDERVDFTHTENLPTDDPELGLRWMAYIAMNADELKRQAGVERTGRKASKEVYCFSLSWHPEEKPEQTHMIETGRSALAALGLQDHQVVMVSHRDEAYSHLHCIVNLVNPNHGKMHTLQYSRRRLSTWAEAYEREHGKIYCEQRVENNKRRKKGEYVKYQDPEQDQKAIIEKLFKSADSGKAFQSALTEVGMTLAQGKKIVVIDRDGQPHSLARRIDGMREKDVRAFVAGLTLPDADEVQKRQEEERSKQAAKQVSARQNQQPEEQEKDGRSGRSDTEGNAAGQGSQPVRLKVAPDSLTLTRMQNQHRDELLHFSWEEASAARSQLAREFKRLYGEDERRLQNGIILLKQTLKERGKLTPEQADKLDTLRHDLAQIEARIQTAERALDTNLKEREAVILARHAQEREAVQNGAVPKKTELAERFEETAQIVPIPPPRTWRNEAHTTSAKTAEDVERDAFLDRIQERRGRSLTSQWNALQPGPHDIEQTATVEQGQAQEEADLYAFLDRYQGFDHAQATAPLPQPQTPEIEDEYATSLSAEFDNASGAPLSESAALEAFLDRHSGGGMQQGVSMGME